MNKSGIATSIQGPGTTATGNSATVLDDLGPLFAGGFMLGSVAVVFSAMVNWGAIVSYHTYADHEIHNWSLGVVAAFCVLALLVSFVIGRWLFRLRKSIGQDGDPATAETIRRKRRSFAMGSMIPFVLFTPLVWLMVLAFTYSSAAM
ncbi:MAG: hypothetical protein ACRDKE_10555 [Solirubrobacterales bacterium]